MTQRQEDIVLRLESRFPAPTGAGESDA